MEENKDESEIENIDGDNMPIEVKKPKRKKEKKTNVLQELDIYWKLDGRGKAKLAIKLTKGERITVILKDPKYLKSLRGHLQTVAKFGLRKNFI